jgi:hypothetical protein
MNELRAFVLFPTDFHHVLFLVAMRMIAIATITIPPMNSLWARIPTTSAGAKDTSWFTKPGGFLFAALGAKMQPRARGLSDAKRNKELSSGNSKTGPGVQIYVFHQRASNLENFWLIWQVAPHTLRTISGRSGPENHQKARGSGML